MTIFYSRLGTTANTQERGKQRVLGDSSRKLCVNAHLRCSEMSDFIYSISTAFQGGEYDKYQTGT